MVSELAADAGQHHENLSIDEIEDNNGHTDGSTGGVLTWVKSVNGSFSPKLLGILLFAQQFTTASAAGVCHALHGVKTKLDLIGLISTFGPEAATKSLTFSALNDDSLYFTGYVAPGSLSVAAVLFEATGLALAHLFALGGTADAYQLARLDSPNGLRYIGLKSNTDCPVANAVGACVVREHESLWKREHQWKEHKKLSLNADREMEIGQIFGRRKGRDANRKVKVITLEVGRTKEHLKVKLKARKGDFFLLGWVPLLLTLGVIVCCILCKERFVAGLLALGTLGMLIAVSGLRLCRFEYSQPVAAKSAPEGDCLVVDNTDPDILHVIQGNEQDIQALFQRKLKYQPSHGKYPMFLAGFMLYAYVIASVLFMADASLSGQILFAIANIFGLGFDMVKASKNGQLGMARKAREQFKIVVKDSVVFQNRTAAVAFVAKHTKDRSMLKSKSLLPSDGPVWQKWWEELAKGEDDTTIVSPDALADPQDVELLKTLMGDMMDGLQA